MDNSQQPDSTPALDPESLYAELRTMARGALAPERTNHTMQSSDLVHEAWLKLDRRDRDWTSRREFFGAASRAMRQVLVDHARSRGSLKRDANRKRGLDDSPDLFVEETRTDILDLDAAMHRLGEIHPDVVTTVEMRFFAGLGIETIAELLGVTCRTVDRHWAFGKSWLFRELEHREKLP